MACVCFPFSSVEFCSYKPFLAVRHTSRLSRTRAFSVCSLFTIFLRSHSFLLHPLAYHLRPFSSSLVLDLARGPFHSTSAIDPLTCCFIHVSLFPAYQSCSTTFFLWPTPYPSLTPIFPSSLHFNRAGLLAADRRQVAPFIDNDGLPAVGMRLKAGDPFYAYIDLATNKTTIERYKGEPATVTRVRWLSSLA